MRKVIVVSEIHTNADEGKSFGNTYSVDLELYQKWVDHNGGINDSANRFISHIIQAALDGKVTIKSPLKNSLSDQPCWYREFLVESSSGYDQVIHLTNRLR